MKTLVTPHKKPKKEEEEEVNDEGETTEEAPGDAEILPLTQGEEGIEGNEGGHESVVDADDDAYLRDALSGTDPGRVSRE